MSAVKGTQKGEKDAEDTLISNRVSLFNTSKFPVQILAAIQPK